MDLSVEIDVYFWLKHLLKQLALVLKLETNLLLISNGGVTGTFLSLAKVFKMVLRLTNFAANLTMILSFTITNQIRAVAIVMSHT